MSSACNGLQLYTKSIFGSERLPCSSGSYVAVENLEDFVRNLMSREVVVKLNSMQVQFVLLMF